MTRDRFRTVVTVLITNEGKFLIGRKRTEESHPISGQWHLLGGHVEHGEDLEEAVRREVKEETGLDVEVRELVDAMTFSWSDGEEKKCIRFVYHVESDSSDAVPSDDLSDVKWVEPEELPRELDTKDADRIKEREVQRKFLEGFK